MLTEHQYFKTFMWKTNSFRGSRRTRSSVFYWIKLDVKQQHRDVIYEILS